MLKWTVEISVDDSWIVDGFVITADTMQAIILDHLRHATPDEVKVRVLDAPNNAEVERLLGFHDDIAKFAKLAARPAGDKKQRREGTDYD